MNPAPILFVSFTVAILSLLKYHLLVKKMDKLPDNIRKIYFGK